jgi:hypothetical protein
VLDLTKNFKKEMTKFDSCEERINLLKDAYKDKTVCIVAPGPSLNSHNIEELKKTLSREDIVVFSIKQAYNWTQELTDFHITSTWGSDMKKGYDYVDDNTIVFYGFTKAYVNEQMKKVLYKPSLLDFWIPISTPPYHFEQDCMHVTGDFDLFYEFGKNYEMRWGNGIMYEQAIPLALYIGCKEFVTIGYDIGELGVKYQKHAYADDESKVIPADDKQLYDYVKSTSKLYDWFKKEKINFRIFSDTNPSDERFKRIGDLNEI